MIAALIGNPNSGKTTLFNLLTGSTARVGNWPGVTVEKKSGYIKRSKCNKCEQSQDNLSKCEQAKDNLSKCEQAKDNLTKDEQSKSKCSKYEQTKDGQIELIDLPGIYSLSPYTPEERVSRDFILDTKPDVIINIVDATNLERNLYLTTSVLETDIPVIIALNMTDALIKEGRQVDADKLSATLGVPVIPISALHNKGIEQLTQALSNIQGERTGFSLMSEGKYGKLYNEVIALLGQKGVNNRAFRAVKLIEGDNKELEDSGLIDDMRKLMTKYKGEDFEAYVADMRYTHITDNVISTVVTGKRAEITRSDKIDKVLTHRVFGLPIFLGIMFLIFHLTFSENLFFLKVFIPEGSFDNAIFGTDSINSIGVIIFNLVDLLTSSISGGLSTLMGGAPIWLSGLVVEGILGGVFAVLGFVPQIMLLFLFLSILEDSGYMARAAFILDRAFRKLGMSGRAFMPLMMCFGCAVPGIMATRALANDKERKISIFLAPFFSCGAKLPIWATFAGIMFAGAYADLIVFAIYLMGIAVAILAAMILKRVLKGGAPPFIMELPSYRFPKPKNTTLHLMNKFKHYLKKAATIIAISSLVLWCLQSFSFTFRFVSDSGDSMLGIIGKGIKYLFVPMGFALGDNGWMFVVAALTGLIAKEMVVAALGVFAGIDNALELPDGELSSGLSGLIGGISAPSAFAFMAFNLLAVPCMAAVAAAAGELKSKKELFVAIAFWLGTAYVASAAIYWGFTYLWVGLAILLAMIVGITLLSISLVKQARKQGVEAMQTVSDPYVCDCSTCKHKCCK